MPTRRYDWKPDVPDFRDHYFSLAVNPSAILDHVDRIGYGTSRLEDQGPLGSCVGNASTSGLEAVTKSAQLSRLMAYYTARSLEGTVNYDAGCMIRDAIKGFMSVGVCTEALWPYDVKKFKAKPSAKCYANAKLILPKVASYQRVSTLPEVKTALGAGLPVVFGFTVPDYFESDQVASDGWVRLPTQADSMIGGHAVLAVGYDARPSASPRPFVWVQNSWGASWGLEGYFKMDEAWFTDPRRLVDDMWVIHPK